MKIDVAKAMFNSGFDVGDEFQPGSFGWHELLDRSCMLAEMFSEHIAEHPAAKHPKLRKKVEKIEKKLYELYQAVGNIE